MTLTPAEHADDSRKGYDLAIACLREKRIRAHEIRPAPGNTQELRWWLDGPVDNSKLETVA